MKLIIAEKPELGKAIAAAICQKPVTNRDGSINCGEYTVISAFGHLFKLKQPEEYGEEYKKWTKDTLPIYFENWDIVPAKDKTQRVNVIGGLLKQAEIVVHAGDPDDEGQLLIDEILQYFKYDGPVLRLSTNDNNPQYIQKQMAKLEDNSLYLSNGYSARARGVADFIVGINYSRFFTLSNRTRDLMNVGRVQTPTLGLVVARDMQIEGHKKLCYYELSVNFDNELTGVSAKFYPNPESPLLDESGRVTNKAVLEKTLAMLKGRQVEAVVEKSMVKEKPPLPLNQVELQTYCGTKYGYSLDETSKAAQELRENYKAITYNRSSSRNLNEEHYTEAPKVVDRVLNITGLNIPILDLGIKSACFKPVKEPHHAIIPTGTALDISRLTPVQKNVYMAVVMFYLAQFMPEATDEKTTLNIELGKNNRIKAQSLLAKNQGWRSYFKEKNTESSPLDKLAAGVYKVGITGGEIKEIETKPPKRYTEITLNKDMTSVAKYVTDPEIREILLRKDKDSDKDKGSIGTESTRTAIITNLITRGYLEKKGKQLISSQKGRELYSALPDEIKKPDMTAKWWAIQEKIKECEATPQDLYNDVLQTVSRIINEKYSFSIGTSKFNHSGVHPKAVVVGVCPRCGGQVIENSKAFSCINWQKPKECKFTLWKTSKQAPFSKYTLTTENARQLLSGQGSLLVSDEDGVPQLKVRLNDEEKTRFGANLEIVAEMQTQENSHANIDIQTNSEADSDSEMENNN